MAIKTDAHQIGLSVTAAQNATWYQPSTPDGTVRLGQGNVGATTADIITVTTATGATVFENTVKSAAGGFVFPDNTTQTTAATAAFPSGTKLSFPQAAAPTGWTQCTTYNDYAIRLVSGTGGGTGGSVAFSTAFASGNTGATTLSTCQIPSHRHGFIATPCNAGPGGNLYVPGGAVRCTGNLSAPTSVQVIGGGASHTHPLSLAVQYVNFIIATKN